MRVAVIGSHLTAYKSLTNKLYDLLLDAPDPHFLRSETTDRKGFIEHYCTEMGYPLTTYYFGRTATKIEANARNARVITQSDLLLAFYDGEDKGIRGGLDLAERMGKKVEVILVKGDGG